MLVRLSILMQRMVSNSDKALSLINVFDRFPYIITEYTEQVSHFCLTHPYRNIWNVHYIVRYSYDTSFHTLNF